MDETVKALLLFCGAYLGAKAWRNMESEHIPPRALWEGDPSELPLTENAASKIRELEASRWAEVEYEKCLDKNIKLVFYGAENYPEPLYDLSDPPAVLYWDGVCDHISGKTVGVVGTRKCSAYGRQAAINIGAGCARRHVAVISGGASGVDGAGHSGALMAGGETFASLGTGIDVAFPTQNKKLFDEIRGRGALISEFPIGDQGEPWHFPRRNRIVAALSEKIIVVEAPLKSGAMITARLALELGREVWAVPGHIDDESAEGANRLIFDGAYPYIGADAFFGTQSEQGTLFTDDAPALKAEDFPPDEAAVMKALWNSGGKTVDNIALEVKMSASDVLKTVAVLAAKGAIYSSGPGRYSAKV